MSDDITLNRPQRHHPIMENGNKDGADEAAKWLEENADKLGADAFTPEEIRELSEYTGQATGHGLDENAIIENSTALSLSPAKYSEIALATQLIQRSTDCTKKVIDKLMMVIIPRKQAGKTAVLAPVEAVLANDLVTDTLVARIANLYGIRDVASAASDISDGLRNISNKYGLSQREAAVVMINLARMDNSGRLESIDMKDLHRYIDDNQYDVQLITSNQRERSEVDLDDFLPQKFLVHFRQTSIENESQGAEALHAALEQIIQDSSKALSLLKQTSADTAQKKSLLKRITPEQAARLLLDAWISNQGDSVNLLDLDQAVADIRGTNLSMLKDIFGVKIKKD